MASVYGTTIRAISGFWKLLWRKASAVKVNSRCDSICPLFLLKCLAVSFLLREGVKKITIESVIMIIPCRTPPLYRIKLFIKNLLICKCEPRKHKQGVSIETSDYKPNGWIVLFVITWLSSENLENFSFIGGFPFSRKISGTFVWESLERTMDICGDKLEWSLEGNLEINKWFCSIFSMQYLW